MFWLRSHGPSMTVLDPPSPTDPAPRPASLGFGGEQEEVEMGAKKCSHRLFKVYSWDLETSSVRNRTDIRPYGEVVDKLYSSGLMTKFQISLFLSLSLSVSSFWEFVYLQRHMIHSVNIYSALIHFPGKFSSLMSAWPHWSLTVASERRSSALLASLLT